MSQLPFGSVPFRHNLAAYLRRLRAGFVSITFRLSALSARHRRRRNPRGVVEVSITFRLSALSARDGHRDNVKAPVPRLNYLSAQCPFGTLEEALEEAGRGAYQSQLPFGSVPFRHIIRRKPIGEISLTVSITFRLSALSALIDVPFFVSAEVIKVSITFRLSALSAHAAMLVAAYTGSSTSQLPFGSVPFRHVDTAALGSLGEHMSQLPFGSVPFRHHRHHADLQVRDGAVSITFRLSALSARLLWLFSKIKERKESQLPFGSVPFRHSTRAKSGLRVAHGRSQLPFGSVPFRHIEMDGIRYELKPWAVSITFRLSALSALKSSFKLGTWLATVSITFRLSALSAPMSAETMARLPFLASQLPFGSVPFRHPLV